MEDSSSDNERQVIVSDISSEVGAPLDDPETMMTNLELGFPETSNDDAFLFDAAVEKLKEQDPVEKENAKQEESEEVQELQDEDDEALAIIGVKEHQGDIEQDCGEASPSAPAAKIGSPATSNDTFLFDAEGEAKQDASEEEQGAEGEKQDPVDEKSEEEQEFQDDEAPAIIETKQQGDIEVGSPATDDDSFLSDTEEEAKEEASEDEQVGERGEQDHKGKEEAKEEESEEEDEVVIIEPNAQDNIEQDCRKDPPPPAAHPFAWMNKGTLMLWASDKQNSHPYQCTVVGEPYLRIRSDNSAYYSDSGDDSEDDSEEEDAEEATPIHWVKVRWEWDKKEAHVACIRCSPLVNLDADDEDDSGRRRGRLRNHRTPTKRLKMSTKSHSYVTPDNQQSDDSADDDDRKLAAVARPAFIGTTEEQQLQRARQVLYNSANVRKEEADEALQLVGPPYGLQEIYQKVQEMRELEEWKDSGLFEVKKGMEIRKMFDGEYYRGTVISDEEKVWSKEEGKKVAAWRVKYEDKDEEHMEYGELLRCDAWRPRVPAPVCGRQLQMFELFSGRSIVTQEFFQRKWKVCSFDTSAASNATIQMDVLDVKLDELDFVPDFILASPPCQTYSNITGGYHRHAKEGKFEKTDVAREHNYIFNKMCEIMYWATKKHPHLIVVIENPVGQLSSMPMMKHFEENFGLYKTTVDYCAFGRDDKKPTHLWTNNKDLQLRLSEFRCANMCLVGKAGGTHPMGVRSDGNKYDFGVIPTPLAEEVADYVHAKFTLDYIRRRKAADPRSPE